MLHPSPRVDLARITLAVLFIGALILAAFVVLRPFIGALIWATMIVIATWPALLWLQGRLWGKRWLATVLMTLALLLVFVVPLTLAVATIADNADTIVTTVRNLATETWPALPDRLARVPLIGPTLVTLYEQARALRIGDAFRQLQPHLADLSKWLLGTAGTAGNLMLQFLLTLIIAAIMYSAGEPAAARALQFGRRLGGERGEETMVLAGQAIRGVALGVGVTALVQSMLAGIGLAIAGVPAAGLLTAVIFMFCIAQIGPLLVLLPATAWLFWSDAHGWGVFLLVWSIVVGSLDNVLRPILIRRGADLPLLLIFAGVIGGLLAFGLVGIFVGPVVLAVAYKLLWAWMDEAPPVPAAATRGALEPEGAEER